MSGLISLEPVHTFGLEKHPINAAVTYQWDLNQEFTGLKCNALTAVSQEHPSLHLFGDLNHLGTNNRMFD